MKAIFTSLCLVFFAIGAFAVEGEYFTAVLQSEEFKDAAAKMKMGNFTLTQIEHTQTMRCPGCYEFRLTFKNAAVPRPICVDFETMQNFESKVISVKVK